MMIETLTVIVISTSGDGAPVWLLAAGPAGAGATYWSLYRYYRNTDKSHAYERDTLIKAKPVQGDEDKVDHISRTKKSGIAGDNRDNYRSRVKRLG